MVRWILIGFLCFCSDVQAQKECAVWYFGDSAGLDFSQETPVALLHSAMESNEGCSVVSDSAGKLLFYTNGVMVWNREHRFMHNMMVNGNSLLGHASSTQSALIVQQPGSDRYFYIFTTDASENDPYGFGVNYSLVDMQADSGRGSLLLKDQFLFPASCEKIAAVHHANGEDVWICAPQHYTDTLFVFRLGRNGLSANVLKQTTGFVMGDHAIGQMKFSPDGRTLAYGQGFSRESQIVLFDFDNRSGLISNKRIIEPGIRPYGLEFSPNSRYLYFEYFHTGISFGNAVYQAEISRLSPGRVNDTGFRRISALGGAYAMQLAPDGRIYIATLRASLSAILEPDSPGMKSVFYRDYADLKGRKSIFGLPSFVASAIIPKAAIIRSEACQWDFMSFFVKNTRPDSVLWDFGDGSMPQKSLNGIRHRYSDSGRYRVRAFLFSGAEKDTVEADVSAGFLARPRLGNDTLLCYGESLMLTAAPGYDAYVWSDSGFDRSMPVTKAGVYSLRVQKEHCSASDTIQVAYGNKFKVYIGNDTAFCGRFRHVLSADKPYRQYLWNTGDSSMSVGIEREGEYALRVLDSNACPSGDTIRIESVPKPRIETRFDSLNCRLVYLKAVAGPGLRYRWNTGDTGVSLQVSRKDRYILTASHAFCSHADTLDLDLLAMPDAGLGKDTFLCQSRILRPAEPGRYLWSNGEVSPFIVVSEPGIYWVRIERNQCVSTDSIKFIACPEIQVFIPDAFSPDRDGLNDEFRVGGMHTGGMRMEIFDRWGEKIHTAEGMDVSWDGEYRNEPAQQGVYLYRIEIRDLSGRMQVRSGILTLLR